MLSKEIDFDISSGVSVENRFYFKTISAAPGLYCYENSTRQLRLIEEPREVNAAWERYAYGVAIKANRFIVFTPYYGKYFVFVNTDSDEVLYFEKSGTAKYCTAVGYRDTVLILSENNEDTIVFNLHDFSHFYPFKNSKSEIKLVGGRDIGANSSEVIVPTNKKDCIAKVSLIDYSIQYFFLEKLNVRYSIILSYKEGYILTGDKPIIVIWNGRDSYRYIDLKTELIRKDDIPWISLFSNAVVFEDKAFFGSLRYKDSIVLDLKDFSISKFYRAKNNEIVYLSIMQDVILMSIIEDEEPKRNCIYTKERGMIPFDELRINSSIRINGAQKEYSTSALDFFLEEILESKS